MQSRSLLPLLLAAAALPSFAPRASADSIFNYNVVTTGDLTTHGGDIYGATFVGGNFVASGSAEFAKDIPGSGTKISVAGNVSGGSHVELNTGGTFLYQGSFLGGNPTTGASIPAIAVHGAVDISSFSSEMIADSAYFTSLTKNSTFTSGTFAAAPTFIAGLGETAVFDVDAADLAVANQSFNLAASGTIDAIIINVTGSSLATLTSQNFNGYWSNYTGDIIFNFEDATTITLSNAWQGTILAPDALVTLNGGASDVNGGIYANALDITAANEIHNDLFPLLPPTGGSPPPVAPLPRAFWPASLLLAALAFGRLKSTRAHRA